MAYQLGFEELSNQIHDRTIPSLRIDGTGATLSDAVAALRVRAGLVVGFTLEQLAGLLEAGRG